MPSASLGYDETGPRRSGSQLGYDRADRKTRDQLPRGAARKAADYLPVRSCLRRVTTRLAVRSSSSGVVCLGFSYTDQRTARECVSTRNRVPVPAPNVEARGGPLSVISLGARRALEVSLSSFPDLSGSSFPDLSGSSFPDLSGWSPATFSDSPLSDSPFALSSDGLGVGCSFSNWYSS